MNKLFFGFAICLILIGSCGKNGKSASQSANDYNEAEYKTLFDNERYMFPTLEGVYVPAHLKKMSLLEIMNFGRSQRDLKGPIYKDSKGNEMSYDSVMNSKLKLLTQMYSNDSGRVVEVVVFEVNDEFIKKTEAGYIPSISDSSSISLKDNKLKDRFLIPTFPGVYAPKELRKSSLLEMYQLGESGMINEPFVKKNDKGEVVGEDYYTSGPGKRYMQTFVDKEGKIKEAVIYEMTEEISTLFTLVRMIRT